MKTLIDHVHDICNILCLESIRIIGSHDKQYVVYFKNNKVMTVFESDDQLNFIDISFDMKTIFIYNDSYPEFNKVPSESEIFQHSTAYSVYFTEEQYNKLRKYIKDELNGVNAVLIL